MNVSAHDMNNAFYCGTGTGTTPWAHTWTAQNLVSASIVTATGGTYALEAPEAAEVPKKASKTKK